jgi:[acyl-carrier-protein] S-malonyltransferase
VVTVLLCPGQGSQKVGMGRDLAERHPAARETFERIDEALGLPLSRLMWEGPEEELTLTHNAQPAILAHTCAVLAVVGERFGGVGAAAGHSLGEYSAWVAAGGLTPEGAARLVRRRGELMLEAGEARRGTMAAVLGLGTAEVVDACAKVPRDAGIAVAANLNAPDQTVISGDPTAVDAAGADCKSRGAKRVLPLKVSGAFHSPLMEPAVPGLRWALESTEFRSGLFPVVANASALPVREPVMARQSLADQLTAPVRWVECMQTIAGNFRRVRFVEVGPGAVLGGLLRRIVPGAESVSLGTATEVERFLA